MLHPGLDPHLLGLSLGRNLACNGWLSRWEGWLGLLWPCGRSRMSPLVLRWGNIIAVLPGWTWTHPGHLPLSVPRIPLPPPLPEQAEKKEERKIGRVERRKAPFIESKNHSKGPMPGRTGLRVKGAWRFHLPEQPTLGGLMGAGTPVSSLGEAFSYIYTHSSL